MSLNGSGVWTANSAGQPVVATTLIEASVFNAFTADVATALSTALYKDGQQTPTANIPMGGFRMTGMGSGIASTDSANMSQLSSGAAVYVSTVAGTADVITLTPSPSITAYAAGQNFKWIASGANTTNVTVNVSTLGAKAVTKNGNTALVAGDIPSGSMVEITYDGTQFIIATTGAATALLKAGGTMTGDLLMGAGTKVVFEGTTDDAFEITLDPGDPDADYTLTLPRATAELGFRNIPQNSKSAAYTTVLSDSGKHIYHPAADTTARTWTIDSNANVPYPIGTAITFDNDYGAGALTIAITSDTLVLVGAAGSTGSRTLASGGQATALKVTATRWRISGTGLT